MKEKKQKTNSKTIFGGILVGESKWGEIVYRFKSAIFFLAFTHKFVEVILGFLACF